jgi:hypothetical protein
MKGIYLAILLFVTTTLALGQNKTENLVIVTLDGMRWQEIFGGADSALLYNKLYTKDSSGTIGNFWNADAVERRKKLFPFLVLLLLLLTRKTKN